MIRSRLAVKATPHPVLDLGCAGGFNMFWSLQNPERSRNQNSCPSSPYQFKYIDLIKLVKLHCVIFVPKKCQKIQAHARNPDPWKKEVDCQVPAKSKTMTNAADVPVSVRPSNSPSDFPDT
jgi:hypothetical protein